MTSPGVPSVQLPPSPIEPAPVPTSIMVASGRTAQGPLVILITDTTEGRRHTFLDADQADKLVDHLTKAVREIRTGLVVIEGQGVRPEGPSSPLGPRNGHAAPSRRYTPPRG